MHSPTLFILSAVLMALVSTVLCAVWHFNKQIPGLRLWTLSYSLGFLACLSLLVRDHLPEPLSVLLTQGTMLWGACLYLLGCIAHTGRRLVSLRHATVFIAALIGLNLYFTVVHPDLQMRFVLAGLGNGIFFLLTARTLASGGVSASSPRIALRARSTARASMPSAIA